MKIKNAIVTGGAGFIGSHIVDALIKQNINVYVIDDLSTGKRENINPEANFIRKDISKIEDSSTFLYGIDNIDVIFHTAALARVQPSIEQPIPFNNVNVKGTHNLLIWAKEKKIKRFIFSSSSSVYGNATTPTPETHTLDPMSPYALHKLIGEQYCKLFSTLYDIDTVSLRYFNVYGDRMALDGAYRLAIPIFAKQIKEGNPCTINNDGKQRRDYTFVGDVVKANLMCATADKEFNGEVYNVGNGDNVSVNELVDMMGGKKSYGNEVIEPFETLADYSKIKKDLNWKPEGDLKKWIDIYMKTIKL